MAMLESLFMHQQNPTGNLKCTLDSTYTALDTDVFFYGCNLSRKSLTEVVVRITDIEILISTSGIYLTTSITMATSLLPYTLGLLSGSGSPDASQKLVHLTSIHNTVSLDFCRGGVTQQAAQTSPSGTGLFTGLSMATPVLTNGTFNLSSYSTPECDVFIHFPSLPHRIQRNSGYSLHLNNSAAYTNFSLADTNLNVSIEFTVRMLHLENKRQAMLAFTNDNVFLVSLINATVYVEATMPSAMGVEIAIRDTNIQLELGQWNKIILTYNGVTAELTLFHFNSSAWLERRDFVIVPRIFSAPGVLSLGSWQPPQDGKPHPRIYPFSGEVENFLIWEQVIEPNLVLDLWLMDPAIARSALHFSWTFDEGQGLTSVDTIKKETIDLPTPPLLSPAWLVSDLTYTMTRTSEDVLQTVLGADLNKIALNTDSCKVFIKDQSLAGCATISQATKDDLYALCSYAMNIIDYRQAALSVIFSYLSMCTNSVSPSPTLVHAVCSAEVQWQETAICSPGCVFGTSVTTSQAVNSSQCSCAQGYYGASCQLTCPGGSNSPCNNQGSCQADGTCICSSNWNGSAACESCTSNYTLEQIVQYTCLHL
ncbi:hypothetical protein C0Q70_07565 [Pomacea canaliculata]|uniref:EGF-like domain-containing protein n=1 Tax=Pomacea canaliculata TaxID=400727 RepID=A0A2T7PFE4_POMCA|nr:hypothetical protein C0Q70_07565 [Pomacea canaliculata]